MVETHGDVILESEIQKKKKKWGWMDEWVDRNQDGMAGKLRGKGSLEETRWARQLQTTQQWCWQKAQQAPVALMLSHTDFFHSVHVSFYFYTWIMARIRNKKGR